MGISDAMTAEIVEALGDRLREMRLGRRLTLAEVAADTAISVSTLSRLESGGRKATLEMLLPLARLYEVGLDELVGLREAPVQPPTRGDGMTAIPLTQEPGGLRAYKMLIPVRGEPTLKTHEGWDWMYVLSGRLRVVLAEHDFVLRTGEAVEFDTHVPHWFGSAGPGPAEVLTLFGPQGERMHVRARSRRQGS